MARITRVAGPGAILTQRGEVPFRVVDLRDQTRSVTVSAITRDGIEVRVPISSAFRIQRGSRQISLGTPWPYRAQRDVLQALFAEEVDPSGRGPLDAHTAHPWEDPPIKLSAHKLEQAVAVAEGEVKDELREQNAPVAVPAATEEGAGVVGPAAETDIYVATAEAGDFQPYEGRLELEIPPPVDYSQILKFQRYLRDVPDLHLVSIGGASDGGASVIIVINQPLPILSILKQMPLVKDVVKQEKNIQLMLKETPPA